MKNKPTSQKTKRIAVITMARDDEFFLSRWIAYYGKNFGTENLYVLLDGTDQKIPHNVGRANIIKLVHIPMPRAMGDKSRINKLSELADRLLQEYDIVIGCDVDEFLIVDPNVGMSLSRYLSMIKINTSVSGLGMDVAQDLHNDAVLDTNGPFLFQRTRALLSTRYTKPVVINRPVRWGSGFHSISGHNFHIDPNLYLLHFGAIDLQMLTTKAAARGPDWVNHLRRRGNGTINAVTHKHAYGERAIKIARVMQRLFRPIYAFDKPGMLGIKTVVKIPERFKETGI